MVQYSQFMHVAMTLRSFKISCLVCFVWIDDKSPQEVKLAWLCSMALLSTSIMFLYLYKKSYSNLQAVFYVFMAVVMTLRGGFTLLVRCAEFWNVIGVTVRFAFTQ